MNPFKRLPGFVKSPSGLEWALWRRLPAILLWGTLLPLAVAVVHRWLASTESMPGSSDGALMMWDYTIIGVVVFHWSMVLTVGFGCLIVMVMKGPAYVADAYPLPQGGQEDAQDADRLQA